MKTEIEPLEVAALVMAGRLPVRDTVVTHGGAVVIRTVAKRESEPDLRAIDQEKIQVSRKYLEDLDAGIRADKETIQCFAQIIRDLVDPYQIEMNKMTGTSRETVVKIARRLLAKFDLDGRLS